MVYIASVDLTLGMLIHLAQKAQIASLIAKKVIMLAEYLDFVDIFSKKSATELFQRSNINEYLVDLKFGKQLLYGSIYSLESIKLETFKMYIRINLANGFIQFFKSLAKTPILFV